MGGCPRPITHTTTRSTRKAQLKSCRFTQSWNLKCTGTSTLVGKTWLLHTLEAQSLRLERNLAACCVRSWIGLPLKRNTRPKDPNSETWNELQSNTIGSREGQGGRQPPKRWQLWGASTNPSQGLLGQLFISEAKPTVFSFSKNESESSLANYFLVQLCFFVIQLCFFCDSVVFFCDLVVLFLCFCLCSFSDSVVLFL